MIRNPIKDRIAIVGVGTTPYTRDNVGKSPNALVMEACRNAILDAGIRPAEIDGVCGTLALPPHVQPQYVQEGLGIPELRWWCGTGSGAIAAFALIECVNAVAAGACTTAICYHPLHLSAFNSSTAARDPFKLRATQNFRGAPSGLGMQAFYAPYSNASAGYAGFMNRYMYEYGVKREHFGRVAINARSNGMKNEHAVMRRPLTMEEYLAARYIREPMCMLDMDIPVDGCDAFVVTTAERARDLAKKPVLVHAATYGQAEHPEDDQAIDLRHIGQQIAARTLWEKSDLKLADADVLMLYDGYTFLTLSWIDNLGYCKPGEAGPFLESHWNAAGQRALVNGRVPINPHGGNMSEGASQGGGHLREAVVQLRGEAGARQVAGCRTVVCGLGGYFFNASALVLRAD
jgi:acetyl-CoA acetyltransferase